MIFIPHFLYVIFVVLLTNTCCLQVFADSAEPGKEQANPAIKEEASKPPTERQLRDAKLRLMNSSRLAESLTTIKPEDEIMLVWFSADDCGYCIEWQNGLKTSRTAQGRFIKSPTAKVVKMTIVKKRSLSDRFAESDFGPQAQFIKQQRFSQGHVAGVYGYPWFAVYVNQVLVVETSRWESTIQPALEQLAEARSSKFSKQN